MTQVHISNRLLRDFGMVPNALWSAPLPLAAKAVAAYLLSLRDGAAMPYVADIEATLGIGRDARRKAFAALEAVGFLSWEFTRDERGAIRQKTLTLDPFAFDAPAVKPAAVHATESQAHGAEAGISSHAPEKPAGGFAAPAATETRPCGDGKSGDPSKTIQDKRARAAAARSRVGARSASSRVETARAPSGGGRSAVTAAAGDQSRAKRSEALDGAAAPARPSGSMRSAAAVIAEVVAGTALRLEPGERAARGAMLRDLASGAPLEAPRPAKNGGQ